jgi:hypothetical protein
MAKIEIPLDLIGQEIFPGDLVIHIHSAGRGVNSSVEVVTEIRAKSVSFHAMYGNTAFERSIKCLKITEEQAWTHRIENYKGKFREDVIEKKIELSRELKERLGRG